MTDTSAEPDKRFLLLGYAALVLADLVLVGRTYVFPGSKVLDGLNRRHGWILLFFVAIPVLASFFWAVTRDLKNRHMGYIIFVWLLAWSVLIFRVAVHRIP
jgi:heme/copper-type cytochrome/quinol oxidase subunit 1